MISLRGQVWAIADWIVSAIQCSALYAGIRMETKGFHRAFIYLNRDLDNPLD